MEKLTPRIYRWWQVWIVPKR